MTSLVCVINAMLIIVVKKEIATRVFKALDELTDDFNSESLV